MYENESCEQYKLYDLKKKFNELKLNNFFGMNEIVLIIVLILEKEKR